MEITQKLHQYINSQKDHWLQNLQSLNPQIQEIITSQEERITGIEFISQDTSSGFRFLFKDTSEPNKFLVYVLNPDIVKWEVIPQIWNFEFFGEYDEIYQMIKYLYYQCGLWLCRNYGDEISMDVIGNPEGRLIYRDFYQHSWLINRKKYTQENIDNYYQKYKTEKPNKWITIYQDLKIAVPEFLFTKRVSEEFWKKECEYLFGEFDMF